MGPYTDLIAHDAEYSLADALNAAESDFGQDFVEYWGLDAHQPPDGVDLEEWRELRRLYGLGQQLAEVAATLLKRKGLGPGKLGEAVELAELARDFQAKVDVLLDGVRDKLGDEAAAKAYWQLLPQAPKDPRTRRGVFQTSLELGTSRLFLPPLKQVVARVQMLLKFLVAGHGERTNSFLSHVARCYCLDHRAELAVMCRAVLDTALQDIAPDDVVRAKLGGRAAERVGLSRRLDYVRASELLSAAEVASMDRVKSAGDDAVHIAPGLEPAPDTLMSDLVAGLVAIERARTR